MATISELWKLSDPLDNNKFWTIFLPPLLTQSSKSSLNLLFTARKTQKKFLFQKAGTAFIHNLHVINTNEYKN